MKADRNEAIVFVPINLVYDTIGKFMSEEFFFKGSMAPGDKIENAKTNYLMFNEYQVGSQKSSDYEINWIDTSSKNIVAEYKPLEFQDSDMIPEQKKPVYRR